MDNSAFKLTQDNHPSIIVIDNFYDDPEKMRNLALTTPKKTDIRYWKGKRSNPIPSNELIHIKEKFEKMLGIKIEKEFRSHFHLQTATDQLVYHSDQLDWAAVVYLTPDAPVECGTDLIKSKITSLRTIPTPEDCKRFNKNHQEMMQLMYGKNVVDASKWEVCDRIGNVFNRIIIWHGRLPHSVAGMFGHDDESGRLVQLFFFQ